MTSCPLGSASWATCPITWGAIWFIVASLLLWQAWNKVIAPQIKGKSVKWWHSFLFIAAMSVLFCLPRYMKRHHCGGDHKQCCMHDGGKGCPMSGDKKEMSAPK